MSCLPKPVLRGHVQRYGLKTVVSSVTVACINSALFYFLYVVPKQKKYEEFWKTYDPEAHMADLVKWGYMKTLSN